MSSDVFRFDELTWPEVAALPRTVPLILPLGNKFNLEADSWLAWNTGTSWHSPFHPIWLGRQ